MRLQNKPGTYIHGLADAFESGGVRASIVALVVVLSSFF
jgi:hypothetical protein